MNLLVRCRCEQWVLDELSPNQTFYNLDCSICSRSTLWSFEHVGKRPTCQTTVTADNVFWNQIPAISGQTMRDPVRKPKNSTRK